MKVDIINEENFPTTLLVLGMDIMLDEKKIIAMSMLKIQIDDNSTLISSFEPYVLQVLIDNRGKTMNNIEIVSRVKNKYGLELADSIIVTILNSLLKKKIVEIERSSQTYKLLSNIPDAISDQDLREAIRTWNALTDDLSEYAKAELNRTLPIDKAKASLMSFLNKFSIACLHISTNGDLGLNYDENSMSEDEVIIAQYLAHISEKKPVEYNNFRSILVGFMHYCLIETLTQVMPKNDFRDVVFYLDGPVVLQLLGFSNDAKSKLCQSMLRLIQKLKGEVKIFSHTRRELNRVLNGAVNNFSNYDDPMDVVVNYRRRGKTRSGLVSDIARIDDYLQKYGIIIDDKTHEKWDLLDYNNLKSALKNINYRNEEALEDDIKSIYLINTIRGTINVDCIETCKAILITANPGLVEIVGKYGPDYGESCTIRSCILHYSISNIAWLKAPLEVPLLPQEELIAFSCAMLKPKKGLLDRLVKIVDEIEKTGEYSENDIAILKYSPVTLDEITKYTLNDETGLTEQEIPEILERVKKAIGAEKEEEMNKIVSKKEAELKASEEEKTRIAIDKELQKNKDRATIEQLKNEIEVSEKEKKHLANIMAWVVYIVWMIIAIIATYYTVVGNWNIDIPLFGNYCRALFTLITVIGVLLPRKFTKIVETTILKWIK